jgi:hypothetical protein
VALNVEAEPIGATFTLSDETTAYGYSAWDDIAGLDVMASHVEWLRDVLSGPPAPVVRCGRAGINTSHLSGEEIPSPRSGLMNVAARVRPSQGLRRRGEIA